jgi:hypothetical protein
MCESSAASAFTVLASDLATRDQSEVISNGHWWRHVAASPRLSADLVSERSCMEPNDSWRPEDMPPLPELVRFRPWIVLILVFGLVGAVIAYFAIDAGLYRVGLGMLIGMAFGAMVPFFQLWGAAYYPDEETKREVAERLAEKQAAQGRAREKWGDRRKAFVAVGVLGYLVGAAWNGS